MKLWSLKMENAIFYYLSQVPWNFRGIAEKIFNLMAKEPFVIFSTDMYHPNSVKAVEKLRRGSAAKLIVRGDNTKKRKEWKSFLTNNENKKQLIEILPAVWSSYSCKDNIQDRVVILTCEGEAYEISVEEQQASCKKITSLKSSQEETDTRVVLYCKYGKENGFKYARVRSADSDTFFILIYYVQYFQGITILLETGKGNKKRMINVTKIAEKYSQVNCAVLLGIHAFTSCDSTSAFKGKGKVKAIRLLQEKENYQRVFYRLGDKLDISNDLLSALSEVTSALYGKSRMADVNKVRYCRVVEVCGSNEDESLWQPKTSDTSLIPPSQGSLNEHSKRANFQAAIWKRAHLPVYDVPAPTDGHGWEVSEGTMEPKWNSTDILPQNIADLLAKEPGNLESDENSDSDIESDVGSDHELYSENSDEED